MQTAGVTLTSMALHPTTLLCLIIVTIISRWQKLVVLPFILLAHLPLIHVLLEFINNALMLILVNKGCVRRESSSDSGNRRMVGQQGWTGHVPRTAMQRYFTGTENMAVMLPHLKTNIPQPKSSILVFPPLTRPVPSIPLSSAMITSAGTRSECPSPTFR